MFTLNKTKKVNQKRFLTLFAVFVLVLIIGSSYAFLAIQNNYENNEELIIGMAAHEINSIIYIANDQGYFSKNGLNVNIEIYPTGRLAVEAMLNDQVDIALTTDFVIVGQALNNVSLCTFATTCKFLSSYVVGVKDRGIENITDLIGKKIGVTLGSSSEFHLGRFLILNRINQTQVTLVDIRPEQLIDNLANNTVDAVIAWNPYVKMIEEKYGGNITVWAAQSEQTTNNNAICTNNWAQEHPDTIKKFLRALIQAEDYIINNQNNTINIIAKKLSYTNTYLSSIWSNYQFSISLDEALISQMENQARWMIKNNVTSAQNAPDFISYIYLDGLNAVRSRSVNIIGWLEK